MVSRIHTVFLCVKSLLTIGNSFYLRMPESAGDSLFYLSSEHSGLFSAKKPDIPSGNWAARALSAVYLVLAF